MIFIDSVFSKINELEGFIKSKCNGYIPAYYDNLLDEIKLEILELPTELCIKRLSFLKKEEDFKEYISHYLLEKYKNKVAHYNFTFDDENIYIARIQWDIIL